MDENLYVITPPAGPVVSVTEMKRQINEPIAQADHEAYLETATAAAEQFVANKIKRSLLAQTLEYRLSSFPCWRYIRIPRPPLIEVVSVKYVDADGAEQTFDASKYHITGIKAHRGQLQIKSNETWPTLATDWPDAVIVRYRAGYLDGNSPPGDDVPKPIRQAIMLVAAHFFAHRESVVIGQTAVALPQAVDDLLQDYVVY